MQRQILSGILIASLGFALGCTPATQGPSSEEMLAAARQADQDFIAAFNQGDAAATASMYWNSPDLVFFPPGTLQVHGSSDVQEEFEQIFAAMPGAMIQLTEIRLMVAGDVVIGWGLFNITIPGPDGPTLALDGRYTVVMAERDGKWVYIHDHASAPLPPPPDSE